MTKRLSQFLDRLSELSLVPGDEVQALVAQLDRHASDDPVGALAAELTRRGQLTDYQANVLCGRRSGPLSFGEYQVLEEIGAGGMGVVYKVNHRRMHRVAALKTIGARWQNASRDLATRFLREIRTTARLTHPHVVMAYDAGEQDGTIYLVMEFVAGTSLHELSRQRGLLPAHVAADYVRQAAIGLAYAHSQGVVHRDVKPSNLLLDQSGVIKILDLGLAYVMADCTIEGRGADELTTSGQIIGTLDFLAPEQAEDPHRADPRADIYGLGCTLYRLLTGRNLYSGGNLQKLAAHKSAAIPSLRALRPDIPCELDEIYQRMVAKRPEDRWGSMTEVAGRLEACAVSLVHASMTEPTAFLPHDLAAPEANSDSTRTMEPPPRPESTAGREARESTPVVERVLPTPAAPPFANRLRLGLLALVLVAGLVGAYLQRGGRAIDDRDAVRQDSPPTKAASQAVAAPDPPLAVASLPFDAARLASVSAPPDQSAPRATTSPSGAEHTPQELGAKFSAEEAALAQQEWSAQQGWPVLTQNSLHMELVLIPPSPGVMARPLYFGRHEVTQAQYQQLIGVNPSAYSATGSRSQQVFGLNTSRWPVESVNLDDAEVFCTRLSELRAEREAGRKYRLPTQAEWRFACRAGSAEAYSFGADPADLPKYCWFQETSANRPHDVGNKASNAFGLFDMHGNVHEWTSSKFGSLHVTCGGAFHQFAEHCGSHASSNSLRTERANTCGLRVVCEIEVAN